MAQVRVVQVPIQGIQIGTIGRTLTAAPTGTNIQLGKFNNTTGTFYRDPTNPSAGGAGQQIQVGTNISNRTLGYIVGTGTTATTTIATQTLPGAGYFSIWNAGNVQQSAITIQVPNATGQQAKATGSQSNQPAVNQPAKNQPLNQQAANYYPGFSQPLNQQAANYYPGVYIAANYYGGVYQAANYYPGLQQPLVQNPGYYVPPTEYGDSTVPGFYVPPGTQQPLNQQPPNYYPGVYQAPNYYPGVYQAPNYYPGFFQPLNQQAPNYYAGFSQPLVNQPLVQQAAVITPATNQAATGALYNGSLVNPGQIASQGFAITIPNIGTLTTQGGVLQGTGVGGSFQFPGTYQRTASAAVRTQQGIVNFQGTTRN